MTTVGRKLSTNIRVFTGSFWTWIVPVIALVLLFFLVVQRGWERDMPKGSALRAGVSAALLCGLLGFAVNDSGTVVTALVFVYLGPFITLLALDRVNPSDSLLDGDFGAARGTAGASGAAPSDAGGAGGASGAGGSGGVGVLPRPALGMPVVAGTGPL
jgi:hypothetical protein